MNFNANWQPLDCLNIPAISGVYGFKLFERWLYVGHSQNLKQRLSKRHIPFQIALGLPGVTFLFCATELHKELEPLLIRTLGPEWNGGTAAFGDALGWERYLFAAAGIFCKAGASGLDTYDAYLAICFDQACRFPERAKLSDLTSFATLQQYLGVTSEQMERAVNAIGFKVSKSLI